MMFYSRLFAAGLFVGLLLGGPPAFGQQAFIVANCGTLPAGIVYSAGQYKAITQDITGTLCTEGGGGGGSSYTVNYGTTNTTKGTPTGFNDASSNFQPLLGDTTYGQWIRITYLGSGVGVDGWNVTEGTKADTAYGGSGSASIVSILKGIYANGGGGGGGTVTQGNGSSGVTPWYMAAAASQFADGWNITEGTKADSAYGGSGSASIVAILKGIYSVANSAIVSGSNIIGKVGIDQTTPGTTNLVQATQDPCGYQLKTNVAIATSSGTLQLVAGSSGKKVYICSFHVIAAAAAVLNVIEGTGSSCTTANEAAIWGSTTAASGESYAANGGMTYGNGVGTIGVTATAANGICLLQSGTAALAGNITYVQQ